MKKALERGGGLYIENYKHQLTRSPSQRRRKTIHGGRRGLHKVSQKLLGSVKLKEINHAKNREEGLDGKEELADRKRKSGMKGFSMTRERGEDQGRSVRRLEPKERNSTSATTMKRNR